MLASRKPVVGTLTMNKGDIMITTFNKHLPVKETVTDDVIEDVGVWNCVVPVRTTRVSEIKIDRTYSQSTVKQWYS